MSACSKSTTLTPLLSLLARRTAPVVVKVTNENMPSNAQRETYRAFRISCISNCTRMCASLVRTKSLKDMFTIEGDFGSTASCDNIEW